MTPKEKAKELVEKFKPNCYCYLGSGMLTNTYDEGVQTMCAKQCALIAVEEILNIQIVKNGYWQEVKNEINNL